MRRPAARQLLRFRERVAVDEARLEALFGDDYRAYRDRVPRWLRSRRATGTLHIAEEREIARLAG